MSDRLNTSASTPLESRVLQTLGRVYFFALIPFVGTALAPWISGPQAAVDIRIFMLWSFTLLIVFVAGFIGCCVQNLKYIYVQGLIGCVLIAAGLAAVIAGLTVGQDFSAVAILTLLHWASWVWAQKSQLLGGGFKKQHNRYLWALLTCQMFILFNLIYAAQQPTQAQI